MILDIIHNRTCEPVREAKEAEERGGPLLRAVNVRRLWFVLTCDEQCVHAWWRLGGLEHFGDVLLRQRGLPSALPLGVLLLPPLEVLVGDSGGVREREVGAGDTE